jgi:hypothetical protein
MFKKYVLFLSSLRGFTRSNPVVFSPDGYPARKTYGARLAHHRHIAFVVLVMRQPDGLGG